MGTNKRDIFIGFAIVVAVVATLLIYKRIKTPKALPTIAPVSNKQVIKDKFNLELPDDVTYIDLKDVSGGNGLGLATRKYANGKFNLTLLADLPDPDTSFHYEGWLQRGKVGDANYSLLPLGSLRIAKGGFLIDYSVSKDLSDYSTVFISLEKVNDGKLETKILEGSF